jgi:Lon protease-like protein
MFELPIFPLNTVLFPGMPLHLHIFEERYQRMMDHVLTTSRTFGVCLIKSGLEASGPTAIPHTIGCTARVIQAEPLEDGRMNLTVVGDERFHILKAGSGEPYLSAFVESLPLKSHHSMEVVRGAHLLRKQVSIYLSLLTRITGKDHEANDLDLDLDLTGLELPDEPMMLIYLSAALLQVPPHEKQPLLEADTAALLLQGVLRLYRRESAVLPQLINVSDEQARGAAACN